MKPLPVILVDMDGVLADFDRHFMDIWEHRYPNRPVLDQSRRTSFRIAEEYDEKYRQDIYSIIQEPGFYLDLPAIPGAAAAMEGMVKAQYDVWICSTPRLQYEHCVLEKYQWVEQKLGRQWIERIILTRNKAMICGDLLIDDHPDIKGANMAPWRQVLYDAPYNRIQTTLPRITWDVWEKVLPSILDPMACNPS